MKKFLFLILISLCSSLISCQEMKKSEAVNMNGYSVLYHAYPYERVEQYLSYKIEGSIDILSGTSNSNLSLRYELFSPLRYGMSKYYTSAYVTSRFSYPATKSISYSFIYNDYDNIAREEVLIRFGLYDRSTKTFLNYIESHINNKKEQYIDVDQLPGYLENEPCIYLSDERLIERYDFTNLSHTVDINEYYRLDFSSLYLLYDFINPFKYEEAYLSFIDPNNVFPYIDSNSIEKRVPLKLAQEDNKINIECGHIYVNPTTLDISINSRSGFIETHYLYFPKNKINQLQGFTFTLNLVRMGASDISFEFIFDIGINSLLLGPCDNSLFCIVGGIVE